MLSVTALEFFKRTVQIPLQYLDPNAPCSPRSVSCFSAGV